MLHTNIAKNGSCQTLLFASLYLFFVAGSARSQEVSVDDFRIRAEPAWKKLREATRNISVIANNNSDKSRVHFHRIDGKTMVVETDIPDPAKNNKPLRGIMASNSQYHFWIFEQKGKTWKLNVLEMNDTSSTVETPTQIRQRYTRISNPWAHPGVHGDLADTLENPKCEWKSPRRVIYEGRECIEATLFEKYKYKREANDSTIARVCIFDPENSLALLRSTSTIRPPQPKNIPIKCVVTVEYGGIALGGLRFPTRLNDACQYREGADSHAISYDFLSVSECTLSHGDFYLTNFGLPEPVGVNRPSSGGYFGYLIVASVCFAACSCIFTYYQRGVRRKNRPVPTR